MRSIVLVGVMFVGLGQRYVYDKSERHITRLQPAAFTSLPAQVARELKRRRCTVPQVSSDRKPHNVLKGEFLRAGQTDWAVLCSVNGVSSILVFANGSARSPATIASADDRIYTQSSGGDRFVFSRMIQPAGRKFIMEHYKALGGPKPPAVIDHYGIDDVFVEKASVVWYFEAGKWLRLTGAD